MPRIHSPRPGLAIADAVAIAHTRFGVAGETTALAGENDLNFRIDTPAGSYVLKIAHAGERREHLELQHAALAHLARREPGLALQKVIPALDGADLLTIAGPDGEHHWVRLLTFLPGRLWSEVCTVRRPPPALLESLGATLGTLDRGMGSVPPGARCSVIVGRARHHRRPA